MRIGTRDPKETSDLKRAIADGDGGIGVHDSPGGVKTFLCNSKSQQKYPVFPWVTWPFDLLCNKNISFNQYCMHAFTLNLTQTIMKIKRRINKIIATLCNRMHFFHWIISSLLFDVSS